jgi:hypothetical protein
MSDTSTLALARHEASGKATCNRQIVLRLLTDNPGMTAVELWRVANTTGFGSGLTRHELSRRLPELRKVGLACNGAARVCEVAGTKQMTWYVEFRAIGIN